MVTGYGNRMTTGTLFDDKTVELYPPTLAFGGAWWSNGTAYHGDMLRKFYTRYCDPVEPFTLFDVGASTGAYTLLAAHLPHMSAYAFEPYTPAYLALCENIRLNKLKHRVKAHEIAMADYVGKAEFNIATPADVSGLSAVGGKQRTDVVYERETVSVVTVDWFVQHNEIERVDVLKIDVEGGELLVLRGAEMVLKRDKPLVIAEYGQLSRNFDYEPEDMEDYLIGLGYSVRRESEDIVAEVIT